MSSNWRELAISGGYLILVTLLSWFAFDGNLTIFCIAFGLLFFSSFLSANLFPAASRLLASAFSLVVILGIQSCLQTLWYYLGGHLDQQVDLISCGLAIISLHLIVIAIPNRSTGVDHQSATEAKQPTLWTLLCLTIAFIGFGFVIFQAYSHGADHALRTPWELLPRGTLAALALIAAASWLAAMQRQRSSVVAAITTLALMATLSIGLLVYKLGFGFDGFLHRASEQLLLTTGSLSPKPPYYIGQYVLVAWLARLSHLPIKIFDLLLVPCVSLLIPGAVLLSGFKQRLSRQRWHLAALSALLPLNILITTTPQSFAYVLGLLALCFALAEDGLIHPIVTFVFASWAVLTHPLAGLPFFGALLCLRWLAWQRQRPASHAGKLVGVGLMVGTILSVPLAFLINNFRSSAQLHWHVQALLQMQTYAQIFSAWLSPPANHVALWPDWALFCQFLFPFILVGLSGLAIIRDTQRRSIWLMLLILAVGLTLVGAMLKAVGDFSFLIDYERGSYAERLYRIAELFLLPPALVGAAFVAQRTLTRAVIPAGAILVMAFAWQAAQAYNSYPHHDAVSTGHGWSVSQADVDAVAWIARDAGDNPYTVLASQPTSAAAVEAYGFKRYHGDIFYYSIPTGGPLYQLYLDITRPNASRDPIIQAAKLGSSAIVYVVLNDYWYNADNVNQHLESLSHRHVHLHHNQIHVYRFDVNQLIQPLP